MKNYFPNKSNDRAKACILGAMIGDSLGSTLEFTNAETAKQKLVEYNNFNNGLVGKGPFKLVPGQFTDDSEMALAIMSVIVSHGKYDQEMVANAYHLWYKSNPFDIGNATIKAVRETNATNMTNATMKLNATSLSNGFLMRQFGIVALYHDKPYPQLIEALKSDVVLTHGHPETLNIAIFYGMLLWQSIQGESADKIYLWGKTNFIHEPLILALYNAVDNNRNWFFYNEHKYFLSQADSSLCGFVGFALWFLLRSLKQHTDYNKAILDIVSYGGDTDTNACIVGAVMGALYPNTIPKIWIDNLFACQAKKRFAEYPISNPSIWKKWLP